MLTVKRIDQLKDIFIGWSHKEINIAYQMLLFLKKVSVDQEEFSEFADYIQKNRFYSAKAFKNFSGLESIWIHEHPYECPECGSRMLIADVNNKKCTIVGGKWKSVWTCTNLKKCGHQIWKTKPAIFEIKKFAKPFYDKWEMANIDELISDKTDEFLRKKTKEYLNKKNNCGGCGGK